MLTPIHIKNDHREHKIQQLFLIRHPCTTVKNTKQIMTSNVVAGNNNGRWLGKVRPRNGNVQTSKDAKTCN